MASDSPAEVQCENGLNHDGDLEGYLKTLETTDSSTVLCWWVKMINIGFEAEVMKLLGQHLGRTAREQRSMATQNSSKW